MNINDVNWHKYLLLDQESPSGLSYTGIVEKGEHGNKKTVGTHAGHIRRNTLTCTPWIIRMFGQSFLAHRVIWVMLHGKIDSKLVIDHIDGDSLNNKIDNLRLVSQEANTRNSRMYSSNKSGVTGVSLYTFSSGAKYYKAQWRNEDSRVMGKAFSIAKYGSEEAFRLACEYRTAQIALLNENGANYTSRHGSA